MDLRDQQRIATPECFVCRWYGKHIVLWPQESVVQPMPDITSAEIEKTWTSGKWAVYVNVHETVFIDRSRKMRSMHTTMEVCGGHWWVLFDDWVQVAQEEVKLDYIFNQWRERMER